MPLNKLVKIPVSEIEELKDLLYSNFPRHLVGYGLIANLHEWYQKTPVIEHLDVFSLNGDWKSDGLFIVTDRSDLFVYSMTDENARLRTALKLLDWSRGWRICSLDSRNEHDVLAVLKDLKVYWNYNLSFDTLFCPDSVAIQIKYTIPEGVVVRRLMPEETETVNNLWTYRHPGSEVGVRRLIERNYCVGAYDEHTGQLLGWCLTFISQCHNALQVEPKFMGRGLGKLIAAKLAHERALQGKWSHGHVSPTNFVSQKLFYSLGFVKIGHVFWIETKPRKKDPSMNFTCCFNC